MVKKAIVFTDIKSSSMLWATYKDKMGSALKQHEKQITRKLATYNGIVIKTIGDSYMLMFDKAFDAVKYCIELVKLMRQSPIKLSPKDTLMIRIGMCYGPVLKKNVKIQGKNLIDVFGPTVNKASRMESKVSDVGGFAFTLESTELPADIKKVLSSSKVTTVQFSNNCKDEIARSRRLLTEEQRMIECYSPDQLKGVGELKAFKVLL
jgi:hypothetical protein